MNQRAKNVFKWTYLYWIVFSLCLSGIFLSLLGIEPRVIESLAGLILATACAWSQIYFLKKNKFRKLEIISLGKSTLVGVSIGLLPFFLYISISEGHINFIVPTLYVALMISPFYFLVAFIVQKRILKYVILTNR